MPTSNDLGSGEIVAFMRKARLTKKRSADDLGVDELTDDLGVEIDTRPASQRAGSSRQSWPPSDEEDEAVDVDDENDGDFAPGRRASSRATKKPKRPAGRRKTAAEESSEEEAEESEEEEEEEEGEEEEEVEEEEVEEAEHEVARRGSSGRGGSSGAASSSSGVAGVRAPKPKKVVSSATLLDATSRSYEVDKILTWRWAQPAGGAEVESTAGAGAGGAAGPGAGAAGAVVVDALKAFSQATEAGADTDQAVGMEVELHGGPREFYIKWTGRSYHHSAWVEEEELKGLAAVKLRYFLKVREMSAAGAVTAEEASLMARGGDGLEEIVQPDWLKAERVLDR